MILRKSIDYRDTYDANLLQDVPCSLNRDSLSLKAGNPPSHGTDIWTLYELSWLNAKDLSQVAVGHIELNYTSINLIEPKSFKFCLNSFNQMCFNNWDEVCQTLERDLSTYARGKVSVVLYRLDELEGQSIGHFNDTCTDDQNTTIDNYEFTTDYLENTTSDGKVVEETLVSHLLESDCLTIHQPDWGLIRIQYRGRQINREKLLRYLVLFRHHNELHEQCVERIFNDLLRFC